MTNTKIKIVVFIILCSMPNRSEGLRVKFTNFICNLTDPTFARFDYCKIVAESRKFHYLTARSVVYPLPLVNLTVRVHILQRLNGWKPFLYDVTVGCNFTRRLNKLTAFGWDIVKNISNIDHDCPYNQGIFVLKRVENRAADEVLKLLPVLPGDYGVKVTFSTYNKKRSYARVHFTVY